MPRFAIVEFEDKAVALILDSWFVGDEETCCHWPNLPPAKAAKLVKVGQEPCSSWEKFTVRVLGKAGTYERALEKLRKSEDTSDINTDLEEVSRKRRRIKSARVLANESTDSSDSDSLEPSVEMDDYSLPPPPSPPLSRPSPSADEPALPVLPELQTLSTSDTGRRGVRGAAPQPPAEGEKTYVIGERLMRKLLEISLDNQETLRIHTGLLHSLARKVDGCSQTDITMPEGLQFPLDSVEELVNIDRKLVDPAVANGLVSVLGDFGGRTLDECTKRTMGHVITTNLAMKLNMSGRNGKKAFGPTNLFQAVYRSIKKNPQTLDATKKDIEKSVSKWLIGGRDRDGNRAKRAERQTASTSAN